MTFDLEAALAEGVNVGEAAESVGDKENQEPDSIAPEDEDTLDLETFGKKKKKKKKFNEKELDLPVPDNKEVRSWINEDSKFRFLFSVLF